MKSPTDCGRVVLALEPVELVRPTDPTALKKQVGISSAVCMLAFSGKSACSKCCEILSVHAVVSLRRNSPHRSHVLDLLLA